MSMVMPLHKEELTSLFFKSSFYRKKLEKFAHNFSGNYMLRVVFGRVTMISEKLITVCSSAQMKNISFMDAIRLDRASIVHECGHDLYTDFTALHVLNNVSSRDRKLFHMLWNCLEDRFIVKKLKNNFSGMKRDIDWSNQIVIETYRFDANESFLAQFLKCLIAYCVTDIDLTELHEVNEGVEEKLHQAIDLISELEMGKSLDDYGTVENVNYAFKIFALLTQDEKSGNASVPDMRNEAINDQQVGEQMDEPTVPNFSKFSKVTKPKKTKKDKDEEQSSSDESDSKDESDSDDEQGLDNKSGSDDELDSEKKGSDDGLSFDDESGSDDGLSFDDESDSDDEQGSDKEHGSNDEHGSDDDSDSDSDDDSDSDNEQSEQGSGEFIEGFGSYDSIIEDFSTQIEHNQRQKEKINKVVDFQLHDTLDAEVITEFVVISEEKRDNQVALQMQLDDSLMNVSQIMSRRYRLLFDDEPSMIHHQISGTYLNDLYRMDGRIFSKKRIVEEIPIPSITLLVDQSGSMSRIYPHVMKALTIFQLFCEREKLPLAIIGHSVNELTNNIFGIKLFEENSVPIVFEPYANTREGLSLLWVKDYILKHNFDKNWLFILSDGEPFHSYKDTVYADEVAEDDVHQTESILLRSGIQPIGIGLGTDLSHLYRQSVMVDDLTELPDVLFKLVKRLSM